MAIKLAILLNTSTIKTSNDIIAGNGTGLCYEVHNSIWLSLRRMVGGLFA
jgi:hypothetical protein